MTGSLLKDKTVLITRGSHPCTAHKGWVTITELFVPRGGEKFIPISIQTIDDALRSEGSTTIYPLKGSSHENT